MKRCGGALSGVETDITPPGVEWQCTAIGISEGLIIDFITLTDSNASFVLDPQRYITGASRPGFNLVEPVHDVNVTDGLAGRALTFRFVPLIEPKKWGDVPQKGPLTQETIIVAGVTRLGSGALYGAGLSPPIFALQLHLVSPVSRLRQNDGAFEVMRDTFKLPAPAH